MEVNYQSLLVVKLPHSKLLHVMSQLSMFLALMTITLRCIRSILRGLSLPDQELDIKFETLDFEQLGLLFHDLAGEGLLKKDDKAIIVNSGNVVGVVHNLNHIDNDVFVVELDLEQKSSFLNESLDFVWTSDFVDAQFVDRILKIGGIVAFPLGNNDPDNAFSFGENPNYRIVYVRPYTSIIVAMRKTSSANELGGDCLRKRRICRLATAAKKSALEGLEDVLLEPPRRPSLAKFSKYLKKIKFLPDLLGASLGGYRHLMFVNVGLNQDFRRVIDWFHQNYWKMNDKFEIYNLQVVPEEASSKGAPLGDDISDWLMKNVGEEEYVVMKAEAGVVEEMIKKRTICLVDELFLECNNQWWQNRKRNNNNKSKRAYWECLALYGRLRDVGVAVHQWWG